MLNLDCINKFLDINDRVKVMPGNQNLWFQFKFGNVEIHISDRNGRAPYNFKDRAEIIVYGPKNVLDLIVNQDCALETNKDETAYWAHMYAMTDLDVYLALNRIQECVWSQPLKLESGLDADRMQVFDRHPTFLIRQGDHTGKLYFIDPITKETFWVSMPAVKSEFYSNGYAWFQTEAGTKYHITI